jgi:hypothetical protein
LPEIADTLLAKASFAQHHIDNLRSSGFKIRTQPAFNRIIFSEFDLLTLQEKLSAAPAGIALYDAPYS